ncbi:nucleotidyltransferase family protein [Lutibaculum baratangense]|uniref:Nucleotidyltransferase n=1 Tax=Lutibaculum baratangense AMV1 TaxID=631454 RepID=V4RL21_9HYPH|nr:nucleotidyltransferase family protein [Lutibaculum baratangense]ESR25999.1 nucleotidyltransferase [Lutibaculum baratangense AMV1]
MKPANRPRNAMVLAAGLGTRMRPLTESRPKPLVEVLGKPLIDHTLDRLAEAGIETAVVNVHYLADQLTEHLRARARPPEVVISDERDELLETGGGLKKALPLLGHEPFLLANTDSIWIEGTTPLLARLVDGWDEEAMDALLVVAPTVLAFGYSGTGDFLMTPEGRLRRRPERTLAPFVYTGLGIISPRLLSEAPDGAFSLNLSFDAAIERERLFGLRMDGPWMHVGTPDAIAEAERVFEESTL